MRVAVAALLACAACRDLSDFTTGGGSYQGDVVRGDFVRTGISAETKLCLTLDADHLQDSPGSLSTNDGRFHAAALRPIPQLWHDPLSTLSFGEGRLKNLLYAVAASSPVGDTNGGDVLAVVSLMQSGDIEVRLLRSAPAVDADAGSASSGANGVPANNIFAVFILRRQKEPCSY
ncbi:MAG TPA: hypothetical protein VGY54_27555 [Polyangiaceae bacterium]|jgi:hypothetical protein|nr:hypothetical protein [Polyangiaceae bacterium]